MHSDGKFVDKIWPVLWKVTSTQEYLRGVQFFFKEVHLEAP